MKNVLAVAFLTASLGVAPRARAADAAGGKAFDPDAETGREWKAKLGLSPEQLPKFLSALKVREAELQPLLAQQRAAVRRLRSQLSENARENDVQESLRQIARLRKAVSLRNDQFDVQLASFLEPSQRAKLFMWTSLSAGRVAPTPGLEAVDLQESAASSEAEEEPE